MKRQHLFGLMLGALRRRTIDPARAQAGPSSSSVRVVETAALEWPAAAPGTGMRRYIRVAFDKVTTVVTVIAASWWEKASPKATRPTIPP